MERRLLTILALVNEWLRFAETKNAGLAALNALGATALLTFLAADTDASDQVLRGFGVTSMLLLGSLGVSLLSFLPRGDPRRLMPKTDRLPAASDNLYFFGDLRKYQPAQLVAVIASDYEGIADYDPARHRAHLDLASQIIANARITIAKNIYFRAALVLALAGLAVTVGAAVLSIIASSAV